MDIGYAGAFAGGILTLFSPCSALLLPAFFAYAFSTPRTLVVRTGVFYAGLVSTLVPLGVFAGVLGGLLTQHRYVLVTTAAVLVMALGLVQILGIPMPALFRRGAPSGTSRLSVYVLGAVYGVAGVCTGPILGSILTVAAVGSSAVYGGILLALYALGMALPLFILALVWDKLGISGRSWLRPRPLTIGRWSNSWIMIISGFLAIGIGVLLLLTNGTATLGGVLSVGDQFALETAMSETIGSVSNIAFMTIAAVLLVLAALLYRRRMRAHRSSGNPADNVGVQSTGGKTREDR
ncbi:cytochrome c biogenesis CcdA family protein [Arthrobacter castelli]|uniref:cytochrome c biogenesis CcdA family protein n=1 Tax=Arthrobacter castelli TaxID=271431 RepID=UPI0004293C90|nr:cytochrome c biogenesis CcdA family protein [Arthrobacter castelli]